tara:strand:- start:57616 stop:57753 length:138 start_codon:yes stop_codon:yes gene_type:complete
MIKHNLINKLQKIAPRKNSGEATNAFVGEADAFDLPSHVCSPAIW